MNNKIVLSWMLSISSLAMASEQAISATVYFGGEGKNYIVSDVQRNCIVGSQPNNSYYTFPGTLKKEEITEISILRVDTDSEGIIATGYNAGFYGIKFKGSGYNNLKKDLEGIRERSCQYSGSSILISLWNETEKKAIGLEFTTAQLGLSKRENNRVKSIIIGLGSVGVMFFLAYYFDLYSKGRALLGRG